MTNPAHSDKGMEAVDWGPSTQDKLETLRAELKSARSALVAFSAGVDSTLMAVLAHRELGDKALAVTATSPAFPERELQEAVELAGELGFAHRIIRSQELADPNYAENPTDRCYYCKTELYQLLNQIADNESFDLILDGTNADDLGDHRPGRKAAEEKKVRSLFAECGLTKKEIRELSADLGLSTADKPAFACMASRFPYGMKISAEKLKKVERAEDALRDMGFRQLRVRVHDDLARIELQPSDIERALDPACREALDQAVKAAGFQYVCLDLLGYRQGSLNEALNHESSP